MKIMLIGVVLDPDADGPASLDALNPELLKLLEPYRKLIPPGPAVGGVFDVPESKRDDWNETMWQFGFEEELGFPPEEDEEGPVGEDPELVEEAT